VDLGEAGRDERRDHRFGLRHRAIRRQLAPRIRAEMIAAENEIARVETHPVSDGSDLRHKIARRHASVTALVIDLIARSLDQRWRVVLLQRRNVASMTIGCEEHIDGIPTDSPDRRRSMNFEIALVMPISAAWL
jgi:hypothetical protein